jgi:hypothetical protein
MHCDLCVLRFRAAALHASLQKLVVQIFSNEYQLALAHLSFLPIFFRGTKLNLIVDTLEHEFLIALIFKGQYTLASKQIDSFLLQKSAHKLIELGDVEETIYRESDRRN